MIWKEHEGVSIYSGKIIHIIHYLNIEIEENRKITYNIN